MDASAGDHNSPRTARLSALKAQSRRVLSLCSPKRARFCAEQAVWSRVSLRLNRKLSSLIVTFLDPKVDGSHISPHGSRATNAGCVIEYCVGSIVEVCWGPHAPLIRQMLHSDAGLRHPHDRSWRCFACRMSHSKPRWLHFAMEDDETLQLWLLGLQPLLAPVDKGTSSATATPRPTDSRLRAWLQEARNCFVEATDSLATKAPKETTVARLDPIIYDTNSHVHPAMAGGGWRWRLASETAQRRSPGAQSSKEQLEPMSIALWLRTVFAHCARQSACSDLNSGDTTHPTEQTDLTLLVLAVGHELSCCELDSIVGVGRHGLEQKDIQALHCMRARLLRTLIEVENSSKSNYSESSTDALSTAGCNEQAGPSKVPTGDDAEHWLARRITECQGTKVGRLYSLYSKGILENHKCIPTHLHIVRGEQNERISIIEAEQLMRSLGLQPPASFPSTMDSTNSVDYEEVLEAIHVGRNSKKSLQQSDQFPSATAIELGGNTVDVQHTIHTTDFLTLLSHMRNIAREVDQACDDERSDSEATDWSPKPIEPVGYR